MILWSGTGSWSMSGTQALTQTQRVLARYTAAVWFSMSVTSHSGCQRSDLLVSARHDTTNGPKAYFTAASCKRVAGRPMILAAHGMQAPPSCFLAGRLLGSLGAHTPCTSACAVSAAVHCVCLRSYFCGTRQPRPLTAIHPLTNMCTSCTQCCCDCFTARHLHHTHLSIETAGCSARRHALSTARPHFLHPHRVHA